MAINGSGSTSQDAAGLKRPSIKRGPAKKHSPNKPFSKEAVGKWYIHARVGLNLHDIVKAYCLTRNISQETFMTAAVTHYMEPHGVVGKLRQAEMDLKEAQEHIRVLSNQLMQKPKAPDPKPADNVMQLGRLVPAPIAGPRMGTEPNIAITITIPRPVHDWFRAIMVSETQVQGQHIKIQTVVVRMLVMLFDDAKRKKIKVAAYGEEEKST